MPSRLYGIIYLTYLDDGYIVSRPIPDNVTKVTARSDWVFVVETPDGTTTVDLYAEFQEREDILKSVTRSDSSSETGTSLRSTGGEMAGWLAHSGDKFWKEAWYPTHKFDFGWEVSFYAKQFVNQNQETLSNEEMEQVYMMWER